MVKKRIAFIGFISLVIFTSCEQLGSIDSIEPEFVLTDESAFTNKSSTEGVLNGIYKQWRSNGITQMRNAMFQLTRITVNTNVPKAYEFKVNNVSVSSPLVEQYYKDLYYLVNQASSIITYLPNVTPKGLSELRKKQIVGEAYFNRALANFMLLRSFGDFWDKNSKYGIVLYNDPVRDNIAKPRSSVAECYSAIISDIDNAISLSPDYTDGCHANKIAAKFLKARLQLYINEFSDASLQAEQILEDCTSSGIVLEKEYSHIFDNGIESPELIFAIHTSYPQETITTGLFNDFFFNGIEGSSVWRISDLLVGEVEDGNIYTGEGLDPRFGQVYKWTDEGLFMGKYLNNINGEDVNPYYMMRLAEVYLIKAEADARCGNISEARAALKEITSRAGYSDKYVSTIPDSDLLMKIFQHKFIELNAENYEEWYDIVRYNIIDGVDFEELKYIRSYKHKNLPIPYAALAGNNKLEQNTDYIYEE